MQTLTQKNELERESKKISVVLKIPVHNDMSGVVMKHSFSNESFICEEIP